MKRLCALLLLGVSVTLAVPAGAVAESQHRTGSTHETRHRSPGAVNKLPPGYRQIVVRGVPFYHHAGVFYRPGPRGFVVVPAPIGARISVLPRGFLTFHIAGVDIFYYFGAYYRWLPEERVYVVVEAPETRPSGDTLYLVSGEVLHGSYLGGDANSLRFAVGDEIHHVPLEEVVSLQLRPPPIDS